MGQSANARGWLNGSRRHGSGKVKRFAPRRHHQTNRLTLGRAVAVPEIVVSGSRLAQHRAWRVAAIEVAWSKMPQVGPFRGQHKRDEGRRRPKSPQKKSHLRAKRLQFGRSRPTLCRIESKRGRNRADVGRSCTKFGRSRAKRGHLWSASPQIVSFGHTLPGFGHMLGDFDHTMPQMRQS